MNKNFHEELLKRQGYRKLEKWAKIENLSTLSFKNKVNYTIYQHVKNNFIVLVYNTYCVSINEKHKPINNTYVYFDEEAMI